MESFFKKSKEGVVNFFVKIGVSIKVSWLVQKAEWQSSVDDFQKALEKLNKAIELLLENKRDDELLWSIKVQRAFLNFRLSHEEEFFAENSAAKEKAKEKGWKEVEVDAMIQEGIYWQCPMSERPKDLAKAKVCYEFGLESKRKSGNADRKAKFFITYGTLCKELKDFSTASAFILEALAAAITTKTKAWAVLEHARLRFDQGAMEDCEKQLETALRIATEDDQDVQGDIKRQLARIEKAKGNAEKALQYYNQAMAIYQKTGWHKIEPLLKEMEQLSQTVQEKV